MPRAALNATKPPGAVAPCSLSLSRCNEPITLPRHWPRASGSAVCCTANMPQPLAVATPSISATLRRDVLLTIVLEELQNLLAAHVARDQADTIFVEVWIAIGPRVTASVNAQQLRGFGAAGPALQRHGGAVAGINIVERRVDGCWHAPIA